MSSKIHCTCTATALDNWTEFVPQSGAKPYLEAKLQLDDEQRKDQRWDGRFVFVKCWQNRDYLPDLTPGTRVFVSGSVDARGYMSKAGKPTAQLSIIVDKIEVEGVRDTLPAPTPVAEVRSNPQPATARAAAPKVAGPPNNDDYGPF